MATGKTCKTQRTRNGRRGRDNEVGRESEKGEEGTAQQRAGKLTVHNGRNKKQVNNVLDDEMVQTYETFQSKYSNKLDEEKVQAMVAYGYPEQYVIKSLEESDPNYCTAGYYLLCMDQNYC